MGRLLGSIRWPRYLLTLGYWRLRLTPGYWRYRAYRYLTRYLIRPSIDRRRLPLVAITGTNGKTSVTLMVARILSDAGHVVGASCSEGVLAGGRWLKRGDEAGAWGVWTASRAPGVEALVAETARGGILRNGLGFSECDVGVFTSLAEDHMGLHGIDTLEKMAEVKSVVPRSVRAEGTAVLNLDDPRIRGMAARCRAKPVFFSRTTPPGDIEDCFFLRDGVVVRKRGRVLEQVVAARDVFLAHGGAVTFQLANAMAALAVVEALQPRLAVARDSLLGTLATFGRDPRDLPHRFQLFRYQGIDVLLSASKNPSTYAEEVPLVRRLANAHGYDRLVCVMSDVGDRDEIRYQAVARAVSELATEVVVLPPLEKYYRGRTPDEIVGLLEASIAPGKLVRTGAGTLVELIARFRAAASASTLHVLFHSALYGGAAVEDVLAAGEPIPPRFA
jgi:cyanophycin synthetase